MLGAGDCALIIEPIGVKRREPSSNFRAFLGTEPQPGANQDLKRRDI